MYISSELNKKLDEWGKTRSISGAAEICEQLTEDRRSRGMKLKSKLTDVEGDLMMIALDQGQRLILMIEIDGIRELYMYDSLEALNEEWKDADDRAVH